MLNTKIYEALPYAYLGSGTLVMLTQTTPLAWTSGLLLFMAGALVWVMRSNHRYRPRQRTRSQGLPRRVYEAAPFLYMLAGFISLLMWRSLDLTQMPAMTLAAAVMFLGAGVGSWWLRTRNRGLVAISAERS